MQAMLSCAAGTLFRIEDSSILGLVPGTVALQPALQEVSRLRGEGPAVFLEMLRLVIESFV